MWEQIRSNRRRSAFVLVLMALLLGATGGALGILVAPVGGVVGVAVALALFGVLWLTAVAQGDRLFLALAGARPIRKQDHAVLVNVVEEMSIAAGLARPPAVYLVDDPAPNAFATGRDPRHAAVAVTTGLLAVLDRDELQGVVAHEIGHIKNRDVSLIVLAGVMVGAILMLGELSWRLLRVGGGRSSRSGGRSGGGREALLAVAILLLLLSPFFAQVLYFMLSRRREYLADASGALFTRYPEGLASALEKLGRKARPQADTSKVTAPMYIVAPLRRGGRRVTGWFSTHPPLAERVRILRTMAGGAGYGAYEAAYRRVRARSLIGARTLAADPAPPPRSPPRTGPLSGAGAVPAPLAAATAAVVAAGAAAEAAKAAQAAEARRMRAASDAWLSAAGYRRRRCEACDATLKVPPEVAVDRCLRCGGPLTDPGPVVAPQEADAADPPDGAAPPARPAPER